MAHTLSVSTEFLQDQYLPPTCFLTGATDAVRFQTISLTRLNPWWFALFFVGQFMACAALGGIALLTFILGLIGLAVRTRRVRVRLPATGAYLTGRVFDFCINMSIVVLPAGFLLAAGWTSSPLSRWLGVSALVSLGVSLLLNIGWTIFRQATRTRVQLCDDGRVDLIFPDRLVAVYDEYRDAFARFDRTEGREKTDFRDDDTGIEPDSGDWDQGRKS